MVSISFFADLKCGFGTGMRTCLEPFRLRNRRLGTGIIGMDELDIELRLGCKLNARIDELDIEWPKWRLGRELNAGTGLHKALVL
ncbi:hypothetical protein F8M41_000224 [Gigaspora margarita]|uniref:Uncharacterized protein n=1 Tax=Gigaspora margarita TaxID=4874 RepID=A0A8H3XGI8_GIGMA|nr:hypothetical protein F8M41_000224 [Gigaspora margarita]